MQEIETKVLEVESNSIKSKLEALGAVETQNVKLKVDWCGPAGLTHKGDDPWFLRVRSYGNEKIELTWKAKSDHIGVARKHKEINMTVEDHEKMRELFEELGLSTYAHQEKKRQSWKLGSVVFDLDTYPGMPSYLEIEGNSEEEINDMIKKLGLESHETWNDGERTLIENKYKLNWSEMRF